MLVSQKREIYTYKEEQTAPSAKACQKILNVTLRAKCLLLVVMFSCMAMFITIRSEAIVRNGYDLVSIKGEAEKIDKANERLRLDIARLQSPQRIQFIATKELGMIVPQTIYCATVKEAEPTTANKKQAALGKSINILKVNKAEASKGQ